MLNIGAGANLSGALTPLRRRAGHLVGVDPDESVLANPTLDEAHRMSLEEYAGLRPEPFGLCTWLATRAGVSEPLLRRLRPPEQVAGYHFPTEYRLTPCAP